MQAGTIEMILLILIFIGLQTWWVIPIIKRNNEIIERSNDLSEEVKQLERIFKK